MSRKLFINCFIVFAGVIAGLAASSNQWKAWLDQRHHTVEELEVMRSAEKQQEELLRREARAGSNLGREEMARARGWYKQGEAPADPN